MKVAQRLTLLFLLSMSASALLGAESVTGKESPDFRALGDHLAARRSYLSGLLSSKPAIALAFKDALDASGGESTYVYVLPATETFSVFFSSSPRGGERMPGDYIVRRNSKTGYLVDITVILTAGGSDYVLLRTLDGQRTALDLVSGDRKIKEGLALGIPLYYLLVKSFREIMDLAGSRVPWAEVGAPRD